MNDLKISDSIRNLYRSKPYRYLNRIIIVIYVSIMLVYMFRDDLYKSEKSYFTLFAGTAPNLISSLLFTLVGIFYIVPLFFSGTNSITKPIFLWSVNVINMITFGLIEYLHVMLKLGKWDNNDMIASLIGLIISTVIYFKLRKNFIEEKDS